MKTYGIIGYPLDHSFSQRYFTEKFEREGIVDSEYKVFPIKEISALRTILDDNPMLAGLNVTIPYKQSVLEFLDDVSHLPKDLNACNCIKITDGELIGFNTDIIGFENSLVPLLKPHHKKALILGHGGAAQAIQFVLRKLKIACSMVSRHLYADSQFTYADLDKATIDDHLLIINTTPLGTFPDVTSFPTIPYQFLTHQHLLYDLVYNPEKTEFLRKGEEHKATIRNGYEMLVLQAEESWRIWNDPEN
ncbi:MAG TPA: hypothetical protein VKH37_03580 [Ferruginibacter sp.]|nr:hypothetical protein [Ferruginibacter sp.]